MRESCLLILLEKQLLPTYSRRIRTRLHWDGGLTPPYPSPSFLRKVFQRIDRLTVDSCFKVANLSEGKQND
jgi:hypothetical protein